MPLSVTCAVKLVLNVWLGSMLVLARRRSKTESKIKLLAANRLYVRPTVTILRLLKPDWLLILPEVKVSDHLPNWLKPISVDSKLLKPDVVLGHTAQREN